MRIAVTAKPIDQAELTRKLIREVASQLNQVLLKMLTPVKTRLALAIEVAIVNSPEFESLIGGRLQAELGVPDPLGVLRRIVEGIVLGTSVTRTVVAPVGDRLSGGLTVGILRTDLEEVLGIAGGSFESEGGYRIDWLQWLLTAGDSLVIADYIFVPGAFASSRTGLGIMKGGGGWRVPPEFSGTFRDNWLTRALGNLEDDIVRILTEELQRAMA